MSPEAGKRARPIRRGPTIGAIALIIAGEALGFWLISKDLADSKAWDSEKWLLMLEMVLGGISVVGPPLLLWERLRTGRRWHDGKVLWFSQGIAAWLLWPPVVLRRLDGKKYNDVMSGMCYFYGTPLMAVFVTISLLAGGRFGRRTWRRYTWQDRLGLLLSLAWACTGLYLLSLIYRESFK